MWARALERTQSVHMENPALTNDRQRRETHQANGNIVLR